MNSKWQSLPCYKAQVAAHRLPYGIYYSTIAIVLVTAIAIPIVLATAIVIKQRKPVHLEFINGVVELYINSSSLDFSEESYHGRST